MIFGKRLKELLEENKISQQVFAEKIGYSQRGVSRWINLQSEPTEGAIRKTAIFFDVSTDYLLGLEDETGVKIDIEI
ncbi:MAG: helix-turn-helix transcriptional regulator [Clostridia bacterium]|nr:helix-turn-helix transcriptional regulator [Clostridia bacterium]